MAGEVMLVVDDHPLFRAALKVAAVRAVPDASILEAGTIAEGVALLRGATQIDLVLLDLRIPDADGYSGIATIHVEAPDVPIIVVSAVRAAEAAGNAVRYGAAGYLSKTADLATISTTILDTLAGERMEAPRDRDESVDDMAMQIASLTPSQLKVLIAVLGGKLNKQIAFDIGVSEATVKAHMTVVFRKLGVHNRTQAVIAGRALGLTPAEHE